MPSATAGELQVGQRRLTIRNLDRVVFPSTGTTKGELLSYYVQVGEVMLPHLRERLLHMHRYPEGVTGPRFLQKGCPQYRPDWLPTAPVWSRDKGESIDYCVVNELAALLWAVNIGSLELHTSLHLRSDLHRPTVIAFDLDPGEGAGLLHCCEVALRLRELFARVSLRSFPKTSGAKGLQVYVPLNSEISYGATKPAARRIARAARGADARGGRLADGAVEARRQGAGRLEPEHRAQVDGVRLLRAGQGAPDRVDPGVLGGGRACARRGRFGGSALRDVRRARADRRVW
jgi:DNA ligase D-like protein (predicted polymerase)